MKRKHYLSLALLLCLGMSYPVAANAAVAADATSQSVQQAKKITGKVVDQSGAPVIGASVLVKGTAVGAMTDDNGNFALNAAPGATLEVTLIGYKTVTLTVTNAVSYNVTLVDDLQALDEVVVTAMGIKKEKRALGYAVQDLGSKELLKNKSANVINSLSGKVAGVNITQGSGSAGEGASIIIRGGTSLERDNQPLFVVDGIIYDNGVDAGNSGFDGAMRTNTTHSNRVMDINPEDVENMSVLKGPAASALYGSRAAAGVIIITTKKGKEGNVEVNFSSKFTANWANRLPEQQDLYKRGVYLDNGLLDRTTTMKSWGEKFGSGENMYNNIKSFLKTGFIYDNNISVSGGTKTGNFYISASRYDQTGILPETDYLKNTFRFNGEQHYGKLTVSANTAFSVADNTKALTSGGLYDIGGHGAMNSVFTWPRDENVKHWLNEDGTKYRLFPEQLLQDDYDNPYWIANRNKGKDKTTRFTGGLTLKYDVFDWFNITYTGGIDRYTTNGNRLIQPGSGYPIKYQRGMLSENDRTYEYLTSNLMMNFHKTYGDFDFNLLLGHAVEDTRTVTQRRMAWNFTVDNFFSMSNAADADRKFSSSHSRHRLIGTYGEFRVGYKNIAYATFTGRNDWTSTLPVDNRSYFYPSVSGAFVFTELLPQSDILSFGKVRASWAKVGKDASPYVTNTYLDPPFETINGSGIENSWQHGNENLKPEMTESTELGLEMRFLKGRVGFDFAYYQNKSYNQLLSPRVSNATGYIFETVNAGDISNKGIEISITGTPIESRNFRWESTLNIARNRGKVTELMEGISILYVTDVQIGNAKAASFEGGKFMAISGSKYARDDQGRIILDKNTGMPTYDGLTTHEIGNREPKLSGGFNNSLTYKNWNLSFLLDFRIGGDIYNGTDYYMTSIGMSKKSMNRESLTLTGVVKDGDNYAPATYTFDANKYYSKDNAALEVPASDPKAQSGRAIIQNYWASSYGLESSNFMTNTNWLRLRSISLSYTFPQEMLSRIKFIKGLSATLTGTNLFLWTNYKGMDPETSAAGAGSVGSSSVGMDYCGVPATAGVSFGINVTF